MFSNATTKNNRDIGRRIRPVIRHERARRDQTTLPLYQEIFSMIVVMQKGATQEQVDHMVERVEGLGLKSHVIVGAERTVIAAIGERAARRYMLTGERFDANEALSIGLLHQVVPEDQLDSTLESLLVQLLNGGPQALAAAKSLIFTVSRRPTSAALVADTAERITSIRASDEGREGVGAFLEKRSPNWIEPR